MVRHQFVLKLDGAIDVDTDPEAKILMELEFQNKVCCDMLSSRGFDGQQFRLNASRVKMMGLKLLLRR